MLSQHASALHNTLQRPQLTRDDLITQMPYLLEGDIEQKRAEIKRYFNQTYEGYEALFETLKEDSAFYERPCSLRHPLIFYFGHTATFFTNKLVLAKLLPERINAKIESICAIGVDEMSWDDLDETHYDWPSVKQVREYRTQVKQAINELIDNLNFSMPIDWQNPMWPILMGIEHERIHLETSSVLIRQLNIKHVQNSPLFPICKEGVNTPQDAPINTLLDVSAGRIDINHQDPAPTYGWDNEYGQHHAQIEAFKASKYLVSNAEYLEFVQAGGYEKAEYWDDEGNQWRNFTPDKHPTFWVNRDGNWLLRCMTEEIAMPWDWPAEVNQLEADAFCRWKAQTTGKAIRLPSEDEYLQLREHSQALSQLKEANLNLQKFASSTPVNQTENHGFYDVIGNVWQWTMTPIYPFEGFKVHPLYDDFTMPTYDNKHNIMTGGSWISTGNEINGHSRYAFRRHFFQHAGFRYIESEALVKTEFTTYETDSAVAQYCEFHYGSEYFGVQNFAQAYAQKAIEIAQNDPHISAKTSRSVLEIGCSVGRASFELAKYFDDVTGLDFSARFIQIANQLQTTGEIRYSIPAEGEIMDFKSQSLSQLNLHDSAHKCLFMQQDACNLKPRFSGYDMVVAVNLIDRLYEPAKFLNDIGSRINSNGILVLSSPYTWLEEFTEKQHWIGGYKDAQTGENVNTLEGLKILLGKEFELIAEPQALPFVIRETSRKYQHSLSELTIWKKIT